MHNEYYYTGIEEKEEEEEEEEKRTNVYNGPIFNMRWNAYRIIE